MRKKLPAWRLAMVLVTVAFPCVVHASQPTVVQPKRPNIILILSDDMGYSDLHCYGGEIQTPNLDALANNGVRFTQFYNTARCCPTRSSLLTGLYPHQAGVGHMMEDRGYDGYRGDLNRNCLTIAEALRPAGYRDYAVGKWHVTRFAKPEGPKHNWPLQRGFDRYYGTIHGAGSYFDPSTLTRDNTPISPFADPEYRPATYYYTDAISEHAVRFIREHRRQSAGSPFFLYVAYTAAHWPMHALPEDIAKYKGKYDGGYTPIREQRLARMKELGVVPASWEISSQAGDWSKVENKAWEARCMEVYAAMVDRMDQGIGRILDELRRQDLFENTLIFFLQDNGGCAESMGRAGNKEHPENPRAAAPTLPPLAPESLLPAGSVPPQTRDGHPVLMGKRVMPGTGDTYIAYGEAWANVSNTPFREYKHWVHEGGISTPLIVHWPAGIPAGERGRLERQPGHLVDIFATCLDLAGASYPEKRDGLSLKPLQGTTLRPAFTGLSLARNQPLFWEHEGNRAVREGPWKLVAKANQPWELYQIESDRTEQHDLAAQFPDKVKQLAADWDAYAARSDVLPLGAWRGKPSGKLSSETRFELRAGARLARAEAPAIGGRPFSITARFTAGASEGVLVAQGGTAYGHTLYIKDGKLNFAVRRGNQLASVPTNLTAGPHTAVARLSRNGEASLALDNRPAGSTNIGGLLQMPVDGLEVGADEAGAVGDYQAPFQFRGPIESVLIELTETERRFQIEQRYLNLPVKKGAPRRLLTLLVDDRIERQFEIELADGEPDWWAFLDLAPFRGKPALLTGDRVPPDWRGWNTIQQADDIKGADNCYAETLRPQFHFSSRRGWNNDPNGLVFLDGEYHLFYQHNPYGWDWGNMHWGHAVSQDLVHWQELGEALYPDQLGTVFSGSAVVDEANTSGFGSGVEPVLVCIYTAAGNTSVWSKNRRFTQCLAYSNDRGRTWTKFHGNPVLDHVAAENRDPKVIWYAPDKKWIMALYLERNDFALFASPDLKQWERLSTVKLEGTTECPEFFEIAVDGQKTDTRWIFYGGNGRYLVCRFDGKTFTPESGPHALHSGNCFYASQTYNGIPASDGRRILVAWGQVSLPGMPFNQMMDFPVELSLRATSDGLRLFAYPVEEIRSLRSRLHGVARQPLHPGDNPLSGVRGELFDITAELEPADAAALEWTIRGVPIAYDVARKELSCLGKKAALAPVEGKIQLRALADRASIEIFGNNGRLYMPMGVILNPGNQAVSLSARGGTAKIISLAAWELVSAWR